MKLIWHIIRKDIVRERWGLLFWATLYVAQIVFGLVKFHHDEVDRDFLDAIWAANVLMVAAQFFMGYILVVRLVQADDVSGTRMFWLTRPIHPGRLLRAKGWGAVLLFGLGPVLLLLPWWLYCGFTANDVGWAAVETIGWQLLLIAPAFMIASLTEDFGRALMWGLLLIVFLVGGILYLYSARAFPAVFGVNTASGFPGGGLLFTKLWLSAFLLMAGSAVVAAHQFQTRRFVRSMALAVPMVMLALLAGRYWRWDCTVLFTQINDPEPVPDVTTIDPYPSLQLTVGTPLINGTSRYIGEKEIRTWIQQTMEVRGVPEGWSLGTVRLHQSWIWPDEPTPAETRDINFGDWSLRELRTILDLPAWPGDPETARWQEKLNAERRARGEPTTEWAVLYWKPQTPALGDHLTLVGRTTVRESVVTRIQARAPVGTARVEIELGHPQKLFEFPLKPGVVWSGASRAYRVGPWDAREEDQNQAGVLFMTARPAVRENGLWSAEAMDRTSRRRSPWDSDFVVVNRSDNTIGSALPSGDMSQSGRLVIGGVVLQWNTLRISSARVIRNGKWVASDPDWAEHSSLTMIAPGQMIRVIRELKVEKYELLPSESAPAKTGSEKI